MPPDARIGVYKVGGRDGMPSLLLPGNFQADIFDVFFDADESAIAQMEERNDPARSRIFPFCLSDRNGPATFHLNYDPFTSSLLAPNRSFGWTHWYLRKDYPHAEAMRGMRDVPVELRTLDSLDLLADPAIAPPTTIFLDTQGTELEILMGGSSLLHDHTVAIVTEAEFVPFYEGQPLFGDLCRWLGEQGFIFADFVDGPFGIEPFRTPLGQRGRSMIGFCDALFLRKVETLSTAVQVVQLAFLALYFEHLAYAFHVLEQMAERGLTAEASALPHTYVRFAFDVLRAREEMPSFYPPTFVDIFPTYEESTDRFDTRMTHADFDRRAVDRFTAVQHRIVGQSEAVKALATLDDLPIERTYRAYGLTKQADAIKQRRLTDLTDMLTEFGISIQRNDGAATAAP
jgi:FkbM family methyltransferase